MSVAASTFQMFITSMESRMNSLARVERRLSGGALGASRRVTLNVGGTLFMTTTETLCQEPSCAF
jgi:hypothetical protein